jgi:hypothetical protein
MLALALACAVLPSAAQAQGSSGGMLGLPIVVKENGWARYLVDNEGEPTEVVFRVGSAETHKGKPGRWLILEMNVPELGRLAIDFLVVGGRFGPGNIPRVRVRMPGQPARDAVPENSGGKLPKPQVVKKLSEQIAGQMLAVTEYSFGDGTIAGWSPSVPGVGLTRVVGPEPLKLVAFGVGGDPWKGANVLPAWPVDGTGQPARP